MSLYGYALEYAVLHDVSINKNFDLKHKDKFEKVKLLYPDKFKQIQKTASIIKDFVGTHETYTISDHNARFDTKNDVRDVCWDIKNDISGISLKHNSSEIKSVSLSKKNTGILRNHLANTWQESIGVKKTPYKNWDTLKIWNNVLHYEKWSEIPKEEKFSWFEELRDETFQKFIENPKFYNADYFISFILGSEPYYYINLKGNKVLIRTINQDNLFNKYTVSFTKHKHDIINIILHPISKKNEKIIFIYRVKNGDSKISNNPRIKISIGLTKWNKKDKLIEI